MKMISKLFDSKRWIALAVTIAFTACDNDETVNELAADTETTAVTEAESDAVYEDIDDMATLSLIALESNSGGRLAESAPEDDRFCGNFSFTGDKSAGTIVIDFGDGCEDQRGNIRTGKIFIQYQGGRLMPGSTVTTTLEDFTFNNVAVEGTRTLKNISESLEEYPVFQITLTGGSLTWPDGTVATREVDRVRVWVNAPNPINDEHHVTGTATGITRRGVNYSMEVTDTLVYKRSCRLSSRGRIPVAGTKVITTDNRVITIDFGNGDCDKIVDILVDGNQEEVTLD